MSSDKVVNITMLSYNRLEFTKQSIAALRMHTLHPYKLVVVDNGSDAETVAWLKASKAEGLIDELILNDENRGVAPAANQGWLCMETDYYVKLDNDIVLRKDGWLRDLVAVADGVKDAGTVGYTFETTTHPLQEVAGFKLRPVPVQLGGACVLITPRAHAQVGYWCEDYFPYSEEDLDMGLRLVQAGFRNYYLEDENIGDHLPHGRATEIQLDGGSSDDELDPEYRQFKDDARRTHAGRYNTLWINTELYRRGARELYVRPGMAPRTIKIRAYKLYFRMRKLADLLLGIER
jgi:GT2 family glycosyltransferase